MPLCAQLTVSGLFDSTVSFRAGAADAPAFSYGIEEYANFRFQARRDWGNFYGAVNLFAAAGDFAADAQLMAGTAALTGTSGQGLSFSPYISGDNYIAAIELERLYFRFNLNAIDIDAGLFRLPFGYGQVWGPSDFLNPKNPLKPDARPRGILGAGLSWYPIDGTDFKVLGFGAAPRDPFSRQGSGGYMGLSLDYHWKIASVQALYSFESPHGNFSKGIHHTGLSVKADVVVGLVMDALYTYNAQAHTGHEGLSFSAGADYSFFDSRLIVLAEYLYNGAASSTAFDLNNNLFGMSNEHYLYTGLTWRFSDFTNVSIALISGFTDVSFTPLVTFNQELFQGATLIVSAQVPMDRDLFSGNGKRGELGPIPPDALQPLLPVNGQRMGRYFDFSAKIRLRF